MEYPGGINHAAHDNFMRAEAILSNTKQMLEYKELPTIPESEKANAMALIMNGLANTNIALGMHAYQQAETILESLPALKGRSGIEAYRLYEAKLEETAKLLSDAFSRYTASQEICETSINREITIKVDDPYKRNDDCSGNEPDSSQIFERLTGEVHHRQKWLLQIRAR